jgi:threonine dehydrogenase-like Zn-dependent dehydrogenase
VLLLDRVERRLEWAAASGADTLAVESDRQAIAAARDWAGGDGPEAVFEATGVPELARTGVELVANAGRVVVVGLSHTDAPLRVGDLAFKELDLLGVSCCDAAGFAEAVSLVARREEALRGLVTHEFGLEETHDAMVYAMEHPAEVMKAVVRV